MLQSKTVGKNKVDRKSKTAIRVSRTEQNECVCYSSSLPSSPWPSNCHPWSNPLTKPPKKCNIYAFPGPDPQSTQSSSENVNHHLSSVICTKIFSLPLDWNPKPLPWPHSLPWSNTCLLHQSHLTPLLRHLCPASFCKERFGLSTGCSFPRGVNPIIPPVNPIILLILQVSAKVLPSE